MTDPARDALKQVDAEDVRAHRAGDTGAFRRLYDRHSGRVLGLAYSITGDWARAEDVCQEVFVKAHGSMENFQAGTNLRAWLLTITHHASVDARRSNRPTTEIPDTAAAPGVDLDARRRFEDLLAGLGQDERLVVTLKYREDLAYKDIAEITGKAEGTLRNLVSAALRKLRGRN